MDETTLLAQPADAYMNEGQLKFFENLLRTKHSELSARVKNRETSLSVVEQVADAADAGSIEEDRHLTMGILKRERADLKSMEQALGRISEGDYGWCASSGDPIGLRRLLFNPTASLSVEEQSRLEKRGQHMKVEAA